jgi:hypothetical protein
MPLCGAGRLELNLVVTCQRGIKARGQEPQQVEQDIAASPAHTWLVTMIGMLLFCPRNFRVWNREKRAQDGEESTTNQSSLSRNTHSFRI